MPRKCKRTDEVFEPTRSNMVFKSSADRIKYHNDRANKLRKEKAFIDRPLHLNIKILKEIMANKTSEKFHKQFLLGKGFNFGVFTSYESVNNKNYPSIYNCLIINIDKDYVQVTIKKE